jgi:hypothetical protein
LIELLLTYLQDIVKLPLPQLLSLLLKLLYFHPLSSGKPSLVLMTDLARAGRELTMDVREMPRDGIEIQGLPLWNGTPEAGVLLDSNSMASIKEVRIQPRWLEKDSFIPAGDKRAFPKRVLPPPLTDGLT